MRPMRQKDVCEFDSNTYILCSAISLNCSYSYSNNKRALVWGRRHKSMFEPVGSFEMKAIVSITKDETYS